MKTMSQIGPFIRQLRENKNMSIRQLAKHTGVSPAYISQIENNYRNNPTQHVLRSIADGLGIEYNEFILQINQLTKTGVEEQRYLYEQKRNSQGDVESKQLSINHIDLYEVLSEKQVIYYKGKLLADKEREKVKVMLHTLLD